MNQQNYDTELNTSLNYTEGERFKMFIVEGLNKNREKYTHDYTKESSD